MSNKQLIVLWIGVGLVVLMCLFPPWSWTGQLKTGLNIYYPAGYRFLWFKPEIPGEIKGLERLSSIDTQRLIIQCVIVAHAITRFLEVRAGFSRTLVDIP